MRFKIMGMLFVFLITLTFGCTQLIWLPKSDVKRQNLEKIVSKIVTKLAEKDNYFPPSLITKYVDGVMNSLNKNNGHALIIAHDGRRFTKLTFILENNENITLNTTTYSKDFFAMFKDDEIDQSDWPKLIYQFNTLGYATAVGDGKIKYTYDFEKSAFLITRKRTVPAKDNLYIRVPI